MSRLFVLVCLLATVFLLIGVPIEAKQPVKIRRIGYVSGSGDANSPGPGIEPFRQGLRGLGYIEGKNVSQASWPTSCNSRST
jgi:hypothetical protein